MKNILALPSPDAIFIHPLPDGLPLPRFVGVNDQACALLGMTRDKLLTMTPADIDTEPDSSSMAGIDLKADTVPAPPARRLFARGDGQHVPVEISVRVMTLDGRPMVVTVAHDLTEYTRLVAELSISEERFKTLHSLSRMLDSQEQDILDFALSAALRMTGSTAGYVGFPNRDNMELDIRACLDTTSAETARNGTARGVPTEGLAIWTTVIGQGKPCVTEPCEGSTCHPVLVPADGKLLRHMDVPVVDGDEVVLVGGVANKPQPYTEADIIQFSMLLECLCRLILRKRMEEDLRTAKRAAEAANKAKGQFLANMSHELRTPLNGIMGMTQVLLAKDLPQEQREYLSLSLDAARQLNKVLSDLLALSSLENGKVTFVPVPFDLRDVMGRLIRHMTPQADAKALTLSLDIAPDIPNQLQGDAVKLRQILLNLLFNAVGFTNTGGVTLSVTETHNRPPRQHAREKHISLGFAVSDTGIGIDPSLQTAIFESFALGEDCLTKRYGGAGLGLSIASQLARTMDARIELESTPGMGSVFTLTAPFTVMDQPRTDRSGETVETGPLRILLAEDEQVNSIMASRLLRNAGHSVTVAGDGQQAIDALARAPFDLVLMDVQMPVINGLQATSIIRSGAVEGVSRDLPIIGLTAYARSADRQRFLDAGMQAIVTKPFEADDLLRTIDRVCDRTPSEPADSPASIC
jgi:PAS domain S-box-containing protein